ncbi:MAG: DUF928 domain-containing protein [Cyanobacteria bacterium J06554_1]
MRSQNRLAPISFTLAILLSQLGFIPLASALPNSTSHHSKQALPPVPITPAPPPGNRTPGGGLDGEPSVCPAKPQELTAITPVDAHGKTLAEHPTFWFYMPYTADEVAGGEFLILTEDEERYVYQTSFKLPEQPGLISITLPAEESASLKEDTYYHWYLNLYCAPDATTETDLNIDGWVQRVSSTSATRQPSSNLSADIWYDTIDYIAKQLYTPSIDSNGLGQLWTDLLESVELEEFTQEPVVGPVVLAEDC